MPIKKLQTLYVQCFQNFSHVYRMLSIVFEPINKLFHVFPTLSASFSIFDIFISFMLFKFQVNHLIRIIFFMIQYIYFIFHCYVAQEINCSNRTILDLSTYSSNNVYFFPLLMLLLHFQKIRNFSFAVFFIYL